MHANTTHIGVAAREFLLDVAAQTSREHLLVVPASAGVPPRQAILLIGVAAREFLLDVAAQTSREHLLVVPASAGVPPRQADADFQACCSSSKSR